MKRQKTIKTLSTVVCLLFITLLTYGQPPKAASNPTADGNSPICLQLNGTQFQYYVTYEAGVVFYPGTILINGQAVTIVSISEFDYHLYGENYEKEVTVELAADFSNYFQNNLMDVTVILQWEQGIICGSASSIQSTFDFDYVECLSNFSDRTEHEEEQTPLLKSLHPNSVTELLIIKYMPHMTGNTSIEIMNESGTIIKNITVSSEHIKAKGKSEIDVRDLKSGMYIARISAGGQQIFKKFLKI